MASSRLPSAVTDTTEDFRHVTDAQGRPHVKGMTDRELLEESVATLRAFGDALIALGSNPMLAAFLPTSIGH